MNEFFIDLQNQIGFPPTVLIKFALYFSIGAIFLVFVNKIVQFISYFFSKFSKEKFLDRLNFILKILIFILFSTLVGWILIYIAF